MIKTNWTELKNFSNSTKSPIQYLEESGRYYIRTKNDFFELECIIHKNGQADQTDFETNYKSLANAPLAPRDSDGADMTRVKMFKSGVSVRFHFFSFKTADLTNGVHHKKSDGSTNFGYITYKLFDVNGDEITDAANEADAVKTQIDFEPPSINYEIVAGKFYQSAAPASNVYVHVVGVPDVPEGSGGSISFCSDANLKLMGVGLAFETDGRVPKAMNYDATYHTSKLRIIFYHSAGIQHECMGELEIAH